MQAQASAPAPKEPAFRAREAPQYGRGKHGWTRLPFIQWLSMNWVLKFLLFFRKNKEAPNAPPLALHLRESAHEAFNLISKEWDRELRNQNRKPSLLRVLYRCYGTRFFLMSIWKLLQSLAIWLAAYYLLQRLVKARSEFLPEYEGYLLALGFLLTALLQTYSRNQLMSGSLGVGISIKAGLSSMVYRKLLVVRGNADVGTVLDLIARDAQMIVDGALYFHTLWVAFFEVCCVIAMIAQETGIYVLVGVGILLVLVPGQFLLSLRTSTLQHRLSVISAERVGLSSSVLGAIKIIKYNAWEFFFCDMIKDKRKREVMIMHQINFLRTLNFCIAFCAPILFALGVFGTYFLYSGVKITAVKSFTVLSVSNSLRYPLFMVPKSAKSFSAMMAAVGSMEKYLLGAEAPHDDYVKRFFACSG